MSMLMPKFLLYSWLCYAHVVCTHVLCNCTHWLWLYNCLVDRSEYCIHPGDTTHHTDRVKCWARVPRLKSFHATNRRKLSWIISVDVILKRKGTYSTQWLFSQSFIFLTYFYYSIRETFCISSVSIFSCWHYTWL